MFFHEGFSTGGFQLHFVHNPRKADAAPGKKRMGVADLEKYLTAEHGDLRQVNGSEGNAHWDQYMDNHVGLLVEDVAVYTERLDAAGLPYFTRGSDDGSKGCEQAVFFEIPGGIIAEVAHKGPARTHIGLTAWDLCQNTSHGVLPPSGRG